MRKHRHSPQRSTYIFGAIAQAGGEIGQMMAAEERQNDQQEFNRDEAFKQRDWEERMYSQRYQMQVKDLQSAGLSPLLAYHQGAPSAPSGASATSGIASPGGSNLGPALTASVMSASQVALNEALRDKTTAEAGKVHAEEQEVIARTKTYPVQIDLMKQHINESVEKTKQLIEQQQETSASAAHLRQQVVNLQEAIPQIRATVHQLNTLANLQEAQLRQSGASADLSIAQMKEIQQRVQAQLPQLEAALRELERAKQERDVPRQEQDRAANDRFTGALGALVRSLTGIGSYFK